MVLIIQTVTYPKANFTYLRSSRRMSQEDEFPPSAIALQGVACHRLLVLPDLICLDAFMAPLWPARWASLAYWWAYEYQLEHCPICDTLNGYANSSFCTISPQARLKMRYAPRWNPKIFGRNKIAYSKSDALNGLTFWWTFKYQNADFKIIL